MAVVGIVGQTCEDSAGIRNIEIIGQFSKPESARKMTGRLLSRRNLMFRWAVIFAVVAVIAALLGFGGVAGLSADLAKIFLVVAAIVLAVGFFAGRGPRVP